MKKLILICLLCPVMALAQKEVKPSFSKAEMAWQKGILDEAKAIIDATVASQEYMTDKKGGPSRNASKSWYLRGIIYAGIDTTKEKKYKSLVADPFAVAKESFEKCNCDYASYSINIGMTREEVKKYFGEPAKAVSPDQWIYNGNIVGFKNDVVVSYKDNGNVVESKKENYLTKNLIPVSNIEAAKVLADRFFRRAHEAYKLKDNLNAFKDAEKVLLFLPNDTAQLMNVGIYFAPLAGEDDKAIEYINRFLKAGGQSVDAYLQLYSIYFKKKDMESALAVAKKLVDKYPNNLEYLNNVYNVYVQTNNLAGAKETMMKRAAGDPHDTESRYFLSIISKKLGDPADSKHWIEEVLKINSDHFEANEEMAALINQDARTINDQRNATKDIKKRQELFNARIAKFKEAIPYAEKCVEIKPNDQNSLYALYNLYENLSATDDAYTKKSADLKKRMKALGMEVD